MSGFKRATVRISEEEYRRLHQADMKRRFKSHTKKKGKNSGQTAELTSALHEMENRQRQLEQAFSELDHSLDQAQAEAMQDMLWQNSLHQRRMMELLEETTYEANESLAAASQRFAEELQSDREHHQQSLQALMQHLNSYEEREEGRVELAGHWLRQAQVLADFIEQQFDHRRFLPGRLDRIRADLDFAEKNLAQGFPESSLQSSQQAFLNVTDLHAELEQRLAEWHAEFEKAYHAFDQFVDELKMNAVVPGIGLDGEELTDQVDLAVWSKGKYDQLLVECQRDLAGLSVRQPEIPTEEYSRICLEVLPERQERFESILYEARLSALNSQLRMNIAETALEALEIHGFRLDRAGYLDEDMRKSFTAQLAGSDGSCVTIRVIPSEKNEGELTNELEVITGHPHLKTEQEARLQWEELARTLQHVNLEVSRPRIGAPPPIAVQEQQEEIEIPAPPKVHLIGAKR